MPQKLVANVYAFYRQESTSFSLSVWWESCKPFDLEAVQDAFNRLTVEAGIAFVKDILAEANVVRREPVPATFTLSRSGGFGPSNVSFAARHECQSDTDCHGSSFTPFSANLPATMWASARSILSPPTSR